MRPLYNYLSAIGRTFLTLGDGLAVTFSYLWRRPATIQYPDRTEIPVVRMLPERSRGILEVDTSACTGCTMCAKQCPINCIHIEIGKDAATSARMLQRFDIDVGKCMFCGICQEACPGSGIRHTHEFEKTMADVRRLMLHFVDQPVPVAKPARKDEPPKPQKPLGSIVRPLLANAFARAEERPRPPAPAVRPAPVKAAPPAKDLPAASEPAGKEGAAAPPAVADKKEDGSDPQ